MGQPNILRNLLSECLPHKLALLACTQQSKEHLGLELEMKGEITIHVTEIQRFIREYYQQVHANKLDKLEEMNKFLKILQPSRTES